MTRDMDIIRLGAEMSELVFPGAELPSPYERVITRGGGSTLMPFFFAAKSGNDLIISIRGAAEPGDFMLVLEFQRVDFAGGKAHSGVLRAARWIIQQTRKYIDECTGKIVSCGHSLGGSTSAMVAAVLLLEEHRENVYSVSMAPFPILTQELCDQISATVTSFAYRNDVVPKLTSKNIGQLVRMFVPPGPQGNQAKGMIMGIAQQLIMGILQSNVYTDPTTLSSIQTQIPIIADRLMSMANVEEPYEFYLPGKAFYIDNDQDGFPFARLYTQQDGLLNLALVMNGMMDHSGEHYTDILFALDQLD